MATLKDLSEKVRKLLATGSSNVSNYFKPTSNAGNNFWSSKPAQTLASFQKTTAPIARPAQVASKGIVDVSTMGLTKNPFSQYAPQTTGEKVAYGVGVGLGLVNPLNPLRIGTKALTSIKGVNPLLRIAQKPLGGLAGNLIAKGGAAKYVGRGVANLSQGIPYGITYGVAKNLTGQKYTKGDALTDLGVDLALGAIPGVGGLLIGQSARGFKKMPKFEGMDNKLRAEISDLVARIQPTKIKKILGTQIDDTTVKFARLGDFFEHASLFNSYPQLRNLRIKFEGTPGVTNSRQLGSFDPQSFSIKIDPRLKPDDMRSTLLHEVQHAIQEIEGFARGGSFTDQSYKGLAGEIEARAVERRANLTSQQRKELPFYENELRASQIQPEDVITRFETGQATKGVEGITQKAELPIKIKGEAEPIKTAQTLNVDRLKLSKEAKQHLSSLEGTEPKTVLSNKEVIEKAKEVRANGRPITKEQTTKKVAEELANRQKVVSLETEFQQLREAGADPKKLEELTAQIAKASKVARSQGTDTARALQARNILADQMASPMQRVFKLLDNAGVDQSRYVKDAARVNWEDANEVVSFYRKYVPPKFGEWIDEYRYTNMLSSPKTWITNVASNVIQTGVQPIRKAIAGGYDWAISGLTGKERTQFAGEAAPFVKKALSALPDALSEARQALTGKQAITNLDLNRIPSGNKFLKAYSFPARVMEAGDMFFRNILEAGQRGSLSYRAEKLGKTIDADTLAKQSKDYALEVLFRGELNKKGQGWMLDAIDGMTNQIMSMRHSKSGVVRGASRLFIPFVQTPMNILKQGVEYSPLELVNMVKSKGDTADQLAKATIGSMVMASAGMIAASGNTTWETPTSAKEREEFYASGRQPYSVKIGDKWVSYSKLGPLAYPMAMAGAINEALKTRKADEQALETAGRMVAMVGGFFTDQSYMQSIGDLVDAMRGDEFKATRLIASVPQQFVPLRALQGWVARTVDPIYRKVNWKDGIPLSIAQSIQSQTPFLSKQLPAYTTPFGDESERQLPFTNAVSPFTISQERPMEEEYYQLQKSKRDKTREENWLKSQFEKENEAGAASSLPQDKRIRMADAVFKLSDIRSLPEKSEYDKAIKQQKVFTKIDDILNSEDFTDEEKTAIVESLGVSREDADYYDIARQVEAAKTAYVVEALAQAQTQGVDPMELLASQRKEVNGKMILANGVIDELYYQGFLTSEERKYLKNLKYDPVSGEIKSTKKSGGSTKKVSVGKVSVAKISSKAPSRKAAFKISMPSVPNLKISPITARKIALPKEYDVPNIRIAQLPGLTIKSPKNIL